MAAPFFSRAWTERSLQLHRNELPGDLKKAPGVAQAGVRARTCLEALLIENEEFERRAVASLQAESECVTGLWDERVVEVRGRPVQVLETEGIEPVRAKCSTTSTPIRIGLPDAWTECGYSLGVSRASISRFPIQASSLRSGTRPRRTRTRLLRNDWQQFATMTQKHRIRYSSLPGPRPLLGHVLILQGVQGVLGRASSRVDVCTPHQGEERQK